jgi:hypothetical protein
VDFELLAKVFGMLGGSELSRPANPVKPANPASSSQKQPAAKAKPSQPPVKTAKPTALTPRDTRKGPPSKLPVKQPSGL